MPLRAASAAAGVLHPDELAILDRVFDKLALERDSALDRAARAAVLVQLYQAGMTTEEALLEAMGYELLHGWSSCPVDISVRKGQEIQ